MKNTNCEKNCAFVKAGFCDSDKECPHFVQSIWQQEGNSSPVIVSDCFPKRFTMEQNQLLHRFLCMQSALEEMRNKNDNLEKSVTQLCSVIAKMIDKNDKSLILSDKENLKSLQ